MTAQPSASPVDAHRQKLRAVGVEIAELTSADIADYVELVSSAYRGEGSKQGWTTEADLLGGQRLDGPMAEDMLAEADSQILLARDEQGRAVASVYVREPEDGAAYLGVLAVSPLGQGKGVGSALIGLAEAWVAEHWGATSMRMSVISKREELIAYYERRGYSRTGEVEPFPYGDERFGLPKVDDLEFVLLSKPLG
ncbi:GNAT family N-acetyltransferase [Brevibacterium linens]|uniref:Acetyltransferase (GNAT) family protein n=2 Tax=Brevibacterium linens TaxID=1703 RepID=A0A2H1KBB0_BRELN|nr:GNAT family N-acetyltransferase [Brevibacterium linens]KAB1944098.1 GNAT family N-acetyltransferase [Brevibacterium linens ATCC 9172]SMX96858.1 Acetyltransferase (GNAT) family protein [Brevibacterium linens]SMX99347.1 Acetyltransferase (GNAT) family protein [Brevibacterium linens ATCC 9172]